MVQRYCTKESVVWALNYTDPSNLIGVPKSHHERKLIGKETIEKKVITPDPNLFCRAHFHMLQQMSIGLSTWMSTRRCCLETILGAMNHD
jgi:hypothetical protein